MAHVRTSIISKIFDDVLARLVEEAKKIPYEAEQALCDYLADYLTNTYLKDGSDTMLSH